MIENLPIPVPPTSELGRLITALEAAEATAMAQRLVVTSAREALKSAVVQQRRSSYTPAHSSRKAEDLEADYEELLQLQRTRDREEQQLQQLLDTVRELKERFSRDYTEFYRLRTSLEELQRLAG